MALEQLDAFMESLGALESGNNYGAVGPQTGTYGRARGRFQIMEKIWPGWAAEAGIPGADWRDPAAQDHVARFKMRQYYERFGSWDLVAVAWFAGPGRAETARQNGIQSVGGIKDVLGTSVAGYVEKVTGNMKSAASGPHRPRGGRPGGDAAFSPPPPAPSRPIGGRPGGTEAFTSAPRPSTSAIDVGDDITVLPDASMPEQATAIEKDQIGSDTFGAILSTISNASKGRGGKVLDLKQFLGMPDRSMEQPVSEQTPEAGGVTEEFTPPATDAPMGEDPDHHGFPGLTDQSKDWARRTLGQFPGLRFSSGHRSPESNAAAGGVPNSKHLTGAAADFSGSEAEMQEAASWLESQGHKTLIHDAGSGRHLHVSFAQ